MDNFNHIGLFEGIGGFSYAAHLAGWRTIALSEIDKACQHILKYHFKNATIHGDIKTTNFTIYRGKCDVLTGGFPCQPYSHSGERKGTEDERHLWPEMLRAIREIKPTWIVGENVYGIVTWSEGLVFEQVHADLENEGYEVQTYILPAAGVGAPHERYRVWFVAYSASNGYRRRRFRTDKQTQRACKTQKNKWKWFCANTARTGTTQNATNANSYRLQKRSNSGVHVNPEHSKFTRVSKASIITNTDAFGLRYKINRNRSTDEFNKISKTNYWQNFPTQSPVCGGNDGLPHQLDSFTVSNRNRKRVLTPQQAFVRWRTNSLKQYGNAIVPQVVLQIFNTINQYENSTI